MSLMCKDLEKKVALFLNRHYDPQRDLLIGLSGGPDSLALYHLLLKCAQAAPIRLRVAHLDHGLRTESASECAYLKTLVEAHGYPFHSRRLESNRPQGSLEAYWRFARLEFFKELCAAFHCQAVLLGHQADDVAETTLKRVCEGAVLTKCAGLQETSSLNGLTLWRPLLKVFKQQLYAWLKAHKISWFEDATNKEALFLRSKMRTTILPVLNEGFGKEVHLGLLKIADEAEELRLYLEERLAPFIASIEEGSMGALLDLSQLCPESLYELKYLVRVFVERAGFFLSKEAVEEAASSLLANCADKKVEMGENQLILDRRRLFCLKKGQDLAWWGGEIFPLVPGKSQIGPWKVTVTQSSGAPVHLGWKAVWRGKCAMEIPEGDYQIGAPFPDARLQLGDRSAALAKFWTHRKVPSFLRRQAPLILKEGGVYAEFLSGTCALRPNVPLWQISVER